jgi:membrane-associated phospholipid phosphatase
MCTTVGSGASTKTRTSRRAKIIHRLVARYSADHWLWSEASSVCHYNLLIAWALAIFVVLVGVLGLSFSRLRPILSQDFWLPFLYISGLLICSRVFQLIDARVRGDTNAIAGAMQVVCERSALAIHASVFCFTLFAGVLVFSYLSASLGWPLRDADLAAVDKWIGFDWIEFLRITNSAPNIGYLLALAYKSTSAQLLLLCLFLSLSGKLERLSEIFALLAITALTTLFLNMAIPAAGAYAFYLPSREMFNHFSELAGMWHYQILLQLRTLPVPELDFSKVEGLVTFPSFHTVLAIITTYGTRDHRYLFIPVACLNAAVIVSTLPEGGHYLIDVIAGVAVAGASIALLPTLRSMLLSSLRI